MTDISGNAYYRIMTPTDASNNIQNSLFAIVNEMLSSIDDEETDINDLNPFLNSNRMRNYTIGRTITTTSPLFDIVSGLFDTSRTRTRTSETSTNDRDERNSNNNTTNLQNNENFENEYDSTIEEISFQINYPINLNRRVSVNINNVNTQNDMSMNNMNNDDNSANPISSNLNNIGNTLNSIFSSTNTMFNNYLSSSIGNPFEHSSNSLNILNQILTQSLYDETAYKKKISEKGKSQLIHIRFNKNNSENINTSCPIMQTDFEDEQYVIQLPCNHLFTPDAINRWLEEKPECPVCRFELDSIEVKREPINQRTNNINDNQYAEQNGDNTQRYLFQTRLNNQSQSHASSQSYNSSYLPTRQFGRDRVHLNQNSYLDYLYEEIDNNDFQQALILSYRELVDNDTYDTRENDNIVNHLTTPNPNNYISYLHTTLINNFDNSSNNINSNETSDGDAERDDY